VPSTLLVIDDEPNITFSLRASLSGPMLRVLTASTAREGIEIFQATRPHAVLLDVRLPDMSGLEAYERIREIDSCIPVIIMTAFSRTETAIEAIRRGAFDYLTKPVDLAHLKNIVSNALEVSRLRRVPAVIPDVDDPEAAGVDVIVGNSPSMQQLYKTIGRFAGNDATVLILGESGTGKELVARAIFHYSLRANQPFLAINCAAIPESLLESELFGHEKGAFTGADQRRIGKFEQVNGGTILLDEIGDMTPATQAKALRLLQQQQFERIGGNATIQTDVRIIAATNRNIEEMVAAGTFRRDLYYRLNVFTIQLPPLRERLEDIPQLTHNFIRRHVRELEIEPYTITPDVLEVLQQHDWPGNVRELESALRFAMAQASNNVITVGCLPESCRIRRAIQMAVPVSIGRSNGAQVQSASGTPNPADNHFDIAELARQLLDAGTHNIYRQVGSSVDRVVLQMVMNHVHGNQQQAAELLGISRMTLRNKLRAFEAEPPLDAGQESSEDVEDTCE
jgi:two-component system nitrogen regulation response regulator GlnG